MPKIIEEAQQKILRIAKEQMLAESVMLVKVPRIFLTTALRGCVKWAKENGVTFITEEYMNTINDKRSKEKSK